MGPDDIDNKLVQQALAQISKKDLVEFILNKLHEAPQVDSIPSTWFTCGLSPLESVVRFLKDNGKKTKEISAILHRAPSSISTAYTKNKGKSLSVGPSDYAIPVSWFSNNPTLSILEVVVVYLRSLDLKYSTIARILDRDPKTIWTLNNRAQKKLNKTTVESRGDNT